MLESSHSMNVSPRSGAKILDDRQGDAGAMIISRLTQTSRELPQRKGDSRDKLLVTVLETSRRDIGLDSAI